MVVSAAAAATAAAAAATAICVAGQSLALFARIVDGASDSPITIDVAALLPIAAIAMPMPLTIQEGE